MEIAGANGLFTETSATGADWKFVADQALVVLNSESTWEEKGIAAATGLGMACVATAKTAYTHVKNGQNTFSTISEIASGYAKRNYNPETGEVIDNQPSPPACNCGN